MIEQYNIDVLCISETFLTNDKSPPPISNHTLYRLDRSYEQSNKISGGGVAILINNRLTSKLYTLKCDEIIKYTSRVECVVTSVKSGNKKAILIACIYRPPKYDITTVQADIEAIQLICDELSKADKLYILTGDFNLKHGWCYSMLEHVMKAFNVKQIINEPTRKNALLDLIITNKPDACTETSVFDPQISDHKAVSTRLHIYKQCKAKNTFQYRDFKRLNQDKLYDELTMHLDLYEPGNTIDTAFDNLLNIVTTLTDSCAPLRTKSIVDYSNITKLSDSTKNEMHIRNNLYKLMNTTGSHNYTELYRKQKKYVKKLILQDCKNHVQACVDKKGIWPTLNMLYKSKNKPIIPFTADEINDHFSMICNKPLQVTSLSDNHSSSQSANKFKLKHIHNNELVYAWKRIKNKQSTSTDSIGMCNFMFNLLIRMNRFQDVILDIFNTSIVKCEVPLKMKIAKIVSIPKCVNPQSPNDMRPISILPVMSKLFEKCVYLQLRKFVNANNILYTHQYGFRSGHSAEHAELYMLNKAKTAIQHGNLLASVSLDVKKAFDTINRNLLFHKLEALNIDSSWFKAYMDDRHQYVQLNNVKSNTTNTLRGIVQGGCLSSLAFALYINNIYTSLLHSEIVLFADDSQTCKEIDINSVTSDMSDLQIDCNAIVQWFAQNDLELNVSKTELMIYSSKKNKPIAIQQKIYINDCEIRCSEQVKSLGIIKDQLLTWKPHIDYTTKKANKSLWKLRCLKPVLNFQQMKLAIETLILTQVYYMCVVWGSAHKKYLKSIDKIIKDAHYMLTSGSPTSSSTSDWLYIEEMHKYKALTIAYLAMHKLAPPRFHEIINCAALKSKNTRSGEVCYVENGMCSEYIQLYMTKLWAQLDSKTRSISSVVKFKSAVKDSIKSKRKVNDSGCGCDTNCIDEAISYVQFLYSKNSEIQAT